MVSFQRMKEDFDDISNQVSRKFPGRPVFWLVVVSVVFLLVLLGIGIGYGSKSSGSVAEVQFAYFISNLSASCPPLMGERLATTLMAGQSFEGLSVHLQCKGDYKPYPLQVRCQRKKEYNGEYALEWSGLPVCYPSKLVTPQHWTNVKLARSVSCTGSTQSTRCQMHCIQDYVAIEKEMYECTDMPCRAWSTEEKSCYFCDQNCTLLSGTNDPKPEDLLGKLSCDRDCTSIVVSSEGKAAVWQNKRTGVFTFIGEHNGRPVYQNEATKEHLYYTFTGAEWLVGPDYRKPHAGIQVFKNTDKICPEKHGGENVTKLYIDSSKPVPLGESMWQNDTTITFQCFRPQTMTIAKCDCTQYKVYNTLYQNGTVPSQVEYFAGIYRKIEDKSKTFGLQAPLYINREKNLYLFSHHIGGKVWQMSDKLTTTPVRAEFPSTPSCPDTETNGSVTWEWYNVTTPSGQQLYVPDQHIKVKCISHSHGA
eukprot:TRINITY_DN15551_c0_g1_i4.p1 TRINITY_DN15551_c0_g1~~TRINITY_DN15551_c0_g1_i4.p1  ORF type:complete len:478 (+),score=86.08 TRINITY_DN15551_c0_g1_i4:162-1595(+)